MTPNILDTFSLFSNTAPYAPQAWLLFGILAFMCIGLALYSFWRFKTKATRNFFSQRWWHRIKILVILLFLLTLACLIFAILITRLSITATSISSYVLSSLISVATLGLTSLAGFVSVYHQSWQNKYQKWCIGVAAFVLTTAVLFTFISSATTAKVDTGVMISTSIIASLMTIAAACVLWVCVVNMGAYLKGKGYAKASQVFIALTMLSFVSLAGWVVLQSSLLSAWGPVAGVSNIMLSAVLSLGGLMSLSLVFPALLQYSKGINYSKYPDTRKTVLWVTAIIAIGLPVVLGVANFTANTAGFLQAFRFPAGSIFSTLLVFIPFVTLVFFGIAAIGAYVAKIGLKVDGYKQLYKSDLNVKDNAIKKKPNKKIESTKDLTKKQNQQDNLVNESKDNEKKEDNISNININNKNMVNNIKNDNDYNEKKGVDSKNDDSDNDSDTSDDKKDEKMQLSSYSDVCSWLEANIKQDLHSTILQGLCNSLKQKIVAIWQDIKDSGQNWAGMEQAYKKIEQLCGLEDTEQVLNELLDPNSKTYECIHDKNLKKSLYTDIYNLSCQKLKKQLISFTKNDTNLNKDESYYLGKMEKLGYKDYTKQQSKQLLYNIVLGFDDYLLPEPIDTAKKRKKRKKPEKTEKRETNLGMALKKALQKVRDKGKSEKTAVLDTLIGTFEDVEAHAVLVALLEEKELLMENNAKGFKSLLKAMLRQNEASPNKHFNVKNFTVKRISETVYTTNLIEKRKQELDKFIRYLRQHRHKDPVLYRLYILLLSAAASYDTSGSGTGVIDKNLPIFILRLSTQISQGVAKDSSAHSEEWSAVSSGNERMKLFSGMDEIGLCRLFYCLLRAYEKNGYITRDDTDRYANCLSNDKICYYAQKIPESNVEEHVKILQKELTECAACEFTIDDILTWEVDDIDDTTCDNLMDSAGKLEDDSLPDFLSEMGEMLQDIYKQYRAKYFSSDRCFPISSKLFLLALLEVSGPLLDIVNARIREGGYSFFPAGKDSVALFYRCVFARIADIQKRNGKSNRLQTIYDTKIANSNDDDCSDDELYYTAELYKGDIEHYPNQCLQKEDIPHADSKDPVEKIKAELLKRYRTYYQQALQYHKQEERDDADEQLEWAFTVLRILAAVVHYSKQASSPVVKDLKALKSTQSADYNDIFYYAEDDVKDLPDNVDYLEDKANEILDDAILAVSKANQNSKSDEKKYDDGDNNNSKNPHLMINVINKNNVNHAKKTVNKNNANHAKKTVNKNHANHAGKKEIPPKNNTII